MVVDYENIMDTLISYLDSVNTATADYPLSTNLGRKIQKIEFYDIDGYSPNSALFPYIGVQLVSKEPDVLNSNASTNASREVSFQIELVCVYECLKYDTANRNLYRMIRNIERNIRANIDLNNYSTNFVVLEYMLPGAVTYKSHLSPDSVFNRSASMMVDFRVLVKP